MSLSVLHPSSNHSGLCSLELSCLHGNVHPDGIQCGDYILATLVSQSAASTQSSPSLPVTSNRSWMWCSLIIHCLNTPGNCVMLLTVFAAGQCFQMWWTTLPWDIHPVRTWSLCFSPATPSAVSWQADCLLDSQPWHCSESQFKCSLCACASLALTQRVLPVCRFVGYKAGACSHGDGVATTLIVLFSPVPIALLLIGMVFFRLYPINERQSVQIDEQLL